MADRSAPIDYDRDLLVAELIRDEGERLRIYRCSAGKRTIGVGRNLDDVGIRPGETRTLGLTTAGCRYGITRAQSRMLLANDIDACEADLDRALPWWRRLDAARQRVLLNMCFNLGVARLRGFRNTLPAIEQGRWREAAAGMRASKWARQVGPRAERLALVMEGAA